MNGQLGQDAAQGAITRGTGVLMSSGQTRSLVSVVVPTFNRRAHVLQALESVFAQTYTPIEVIVVNDGSSDDTSQWLTPLRDQGRVIYLEQPNRGLAHARNNGISAAQGEYVAFLDDDDLWPKDKIAWQVAYLASHPEVGVIGGSYVPFADNSPPGQPEAVTERTFSFEDMFSGSPFTSPGQTLVRHSVLNEVGGFDPSIWAVDDLDMYMRLARQTQVKLLPELALFYRLHPNNMSKRLLPMMRNGKKVLEKHLPLVPRSRRRDSYINGYFWLYEYLGKKLVAGTRLELKQGRPLAAASKLLSLYPLFWSMLTIPSLSRMFLRDLTNFRLRRGSARSF